MRYGFTTGSCAAAAAKAAAYMLLLGRKKTKITIETPKGIPYTAQILDIRRTEDVVSCAVQKDGGDDPDVTTGAWIYAKVTYCGNDRKDFRSQADFQSRENLQSLEDSPYVQIDGGIGVGRVTKPGLDQPVGNAAINHVPREMITKEVLEVCRLVDYKGGLAVEIFVPEGEQLAEQTFNPRLGIIGGISILGSSGIVEPMSEKALTDTIYLEMKMIRSSGYERCYIVPGNYGMDFLTEQLELDAELTVKCSNYVGEAIEDARLLGMKGILLIGHVGKWVKLAAGVMNTHSRQADCRMEVLAVHAAMQGADRESVCRIMQCLNTTEALKIIRQLGILEPVMASVMDRIDFYLSGRAGGEFEIGAIMFSNEDGILGKTPNAEQLLERIQNERKQK